MPSLLVTQNIVEDILRRYGFLGIGGAGRLIFVDPANGSDYNTGRKPTDALATLGAGHTMATAGKNDVVILIGDGSTTGTARLSATLTWSKNATHLIGITASAYNKRARIAPLAATTAFTPFVLVTASGCLFQNFSLFYGFDIGVASAIAWRDTGSRNQYKNVDFLGMGDAASAQSTGSRSLLLEGSESVFDDCIIGEDTTTRTVANASLEFKTANCKRNTFNRCFFPFMTSSATVLGIIVAAAGASDRWQRFNDCTFLNNIKSTSTQMTALATLAAAIGGLLLFKNPTLVGITDFGSDATSLAQIYVEGPTTTAATTGIAVNPT